MSMDRRATQMVAGVLPRRVWLPIVAALVALSTAGVLATSAGSAMASGTRSCTVTVSWEGSGGTVQADPCNNEVRIMAVCATDSADYSNVVSAAGDGLDISDFDTYATNCENSAGESPPCSLWYHTPNGDWTEMASAGIYDSDTQTSTVSFTE
jgi:hypothetical protein